MSKEKKLEAKTSPENTAKTKEDVPSLPELVREDPEIIENLKRLDPEQIRMLSVTLARSKTTYSGPLPPAEQFRIYEEACPGAGKRILEWADKEQAFRHGMDAKLSDAMIKDTEQGQKLGFAVMLGLMGSAVVCGWIGQPWLGAAFVAATALDVVRKFIDGRGEKDES